MSGCGYLETETYVLRTSAPEPISCTVDILFVPSHLRVQKGPEITLRRVEFADGSEATNDSDHARLVANRFNDPTWLNHDGWQEIEDKCVERYNAGLLNLGIAFSTIFPAQRMASEVCGGVGRGK